MARKITTLLLALITTISLAYAQTPPDNEIWYTTTDGRTISFDAYLLVSNSYNNGRGVLKFRVRVTSIGERAFKSCKSLTSITIPNSVTSIGECAFSLCSSLKSINIPNSVTEIGWGAFANCNNLTNVTISASISNISRSTFFRCSSLKNVIIPNSVTSIDECAFSLCSSLSSITIPDSITKIEWSAFYGCISLTSITIPDSVTTIGANAFAGCSSLKSFNGKFASSDGRCLIKDRELIAFAPEGLTSYTIPNSVTKIEHSTFSGCHHLTSITIPHSVTWIGGRAFNGCSSLTSIICLATTSPAIDDLRIGETTMIYVPKEAIKAYKKDPNWSRYKKQIKPHIEAK